MTSASTLERLPGQRAFGFVCGTSNAANYKGRVNGAAGNCVEFREPRETQFTDTHCQLPNRICVRVFLNPVSANVKLPGLIRTNPSWHCSAEVGERRNGVLLEALRHDVVRVLQQLNQRRGVPRKVVL